jgi:hypothetical protein
MMMLETKQQIPREKRREEKRRGHEKRAKEKKKNKHDLRGQ